jgi:methyltransferase family protein
LNRAKNPSQASSSGIQPALNCGAKDMPYSSRNPADAALENAARAGVAKQVRVETADMRRMPFAPESFDLIVSRAAIHNLYQPGERAHAHIDDIRHIGEYADAFARAGRPDVRRYGSLIVASLLALLTFGSLSPGSLVLRKGS